jgi:hypothetical protein
MQEKSFFARHWKLLVNIITIAALLGLAYGLRHQIADTIENLQKVNGWVLWLIIPLEVIGYHAQTRMYQQMFSA